MRIRKIFSKNKSNKMKQLLQLLYLLILDKFLIVFFFINHELIVRMYPTWLDEKILRLCWLFFLSLPVETSIALKLVSSSYEIHVCTVPSFSGNISWCGLDFKWSKVAVWRACDLIPYRPTSLQPTVNNNQRQQGSSCSLAQSTSGSDTFQR